MRCSRIILTVQRQPAFYLGIALKPNYFLEGCPMFEVVAAFLVVLSAGIFVAHALDAYRS